MNKLTLLDYVLCTRYANTFKEEEHPRSSDGKFTSGGDPESTPQKIATAKPHDVTAFREDNIGSVWQHWKAEIEKADPKLSPQRAGELAAARVSNAIRTMIADIDDRARMGNITDAEEAFYDSIHVDDWRPTRQLEELSGSRTILADLDDPVSQQPLESKRDRINRQRQEKIQSVLDRAGDSPRLIHLHHKDGGGTANLVITKSAKGDGWQLSWFDKDNTPFGDAQFSDLEDAVNSALGGRTKSNSPPIGGGDYEVVSIKK